MDDRPTHPDTAPALSPELRVDARSRRKLVMIWGGSSMAVALLGPVEPALALGALLAGALAVLRVAQESPSARLLTVAALTPALIVEASAAAVIAAGVAVALTRDARTRARSREPVSEPQRQLMRCRRRGEAAAMLVVGAPADPGAAARLVAAFRLTDAVEIQRRAHGHELRAVLDTHDLDERGLEHRLAEVVPDLSFGWATFPADGVTFDVLLEHARRDASARAGTASSQLRPLQRALGVPQIASRALAPARESHSMSEVP